MSDYYKSLISDDEVIKELIRESKRREGKLPTEATRLKPNLNFFHRTVNNLVSNNTRINQCQDTIKTYYLKDCVLEKPETSEYPLKKSNIDHAFEREMVLQTNINFVKSSEALSTSLASTAKKKIQIKKISFAAQTPNNFKSNINSTNETSKSKHNPKQKLCNVSSSNSDGSSSEDLLLRFSNKEKNYRNQQGKEFKTKNKTKKKNEVICISSDDGSIKTFTSGSEDCKIKNVVKKRKRKHQDLSDEESEKKSKKKKHKNKKQKVEEERKGKNK